MTDRLTSDMDQAKKTRKRTRVARAIEHVLTDHVRNLDPSLEDSWRDRVQGEQDRQGEPLDPNRWDPANWTADEMR